MKKKLEMDEKGHTRPKYKNKKASRDIGTPRGYHFVTFWISLVMCFLHQDGTVFRLLAGNKSPDILFRPRDRIRIHSEGTSKVSKMTQIISIPDQKVFLISEKVDYLSIRNDDYCQEKRVIQCSNLRCHAWLDFLPLCENSQ